jgi:hypothetical protein
MRTRSSMLSVLALALLGAGGCAELHSGARAFPVDAAGRITPHEHLRSGLLISARQVSDLSSRYFGAVEVTFENRSSEWVRIQQASLEFGSPERNAAVIITAGEDLQRWQEGTQRRNAIREANHATAAELLLFGAAVATVAGGRSSVGAAGALVGAGTALAMTAGEMGARASAAETVSLYPGSHLLSLPFSVPPGLAIKRWVVLNSPAKRALGCISHADLMYTTDRDLHERVRLAFGDMSSEWQRGVCGTLHPQAPHPPP